MIAGSPWALAMAAMLLLENTPRLLVAPSRENRYSGTAVGPRRHSGWGVGVVGACRNLGAFARD